MKETTKKLISKLGMTVLVGGAATGALGVANLNAPMMVGGALSMLLGGGTAITIEFLEIRKIKAQLAVARAQLAIAEQNQNKGQSHVKFFVAKNDSAIVDILRRELDPNSEFSRRVKERGDSSLDNLCDPVK